MEKTFRRQMPCLAFRLLLNGLGPCVKIMSVHPASTEATQPVSPSIIIIRQGREEVVLLQGGGTKRLYDCIVLTWEWEMYSFQNHTCSHCLNNVICRASIKSCSVLLCEACQFVEACLQ